MVWRKRQHKSLHLQKQLSFRRQVLQRDFLSSLWSNLKIEQFEHKGYIGEINGVSTKGRRGPNCVACWAWSQGRKWYWRSATLTIGKGSIFLLIVLAEFWLSELT